MSLIPVPKNAREVGECIYCSQRAVPLQREHAIPFGLNGPWTLLRASCPACAGITHRFERDTLKGLHATVRAVLSFQTRRPKKRLRSLPLVLESSGARRVVQVPLAEYPAYLPILLLPPPGVVVGRPAGVSIRADDIALKFIHVGGLPFDVVARRFADTDSAVDFVGERLTFAADAFARTLAKIGFCAAVFALGVDGLRSSPIRKVILGQDENVWHWVGSWTGETVNETTGLHAMQVRASGPELHVILRLFAQFGAPEYHVALGAADPAFVSSDRWPWK